MLEYELDRIAVTVGTRVYVHKLDNCGNTSKIIGVVTDMVKDDLGFLEAVNIIDDCGTKYRAEIRNLIDDEVILFITSESQ